MTDTSPDAIREAATQAKIGDIQSITIAGKGYASIGYKLVTPQGTFIALTQKADGIAPANYAYHFAILKTLEQIDYQYAPRAIYLNPDQTIIIITQVPGESIKWTHDVPEPDQQRLLAELVDALLSLRTASYETCAALYKELSGKELEIRSLQKNVKKFLTDWLAEAKAGKPDPALIKWIEPKIAPCEQFVASLTAGNSPVFVHGDTSEPNILVSHDFKLHLIDWDTSSFVHYPQDWDEFGIAYLLNHVVLFQTHRQDVLALFSQQTGIAADQLNIRATRQQELTKLGDIQWAIMMNARAAAGEIEDDPAKFLAIAKKRIDDYQTLFGANSLLTS